ncbi:hypothetical protein FQB35_05635 [Crassaminicella thermophila]|uniref:Uncharacterized protein n=1 Tax=Crassaminicella thermophila TaxID=2599308 RepID=A0A5C0SCH6_CRATE|nr:hypothetical protein [Crassaminicella thermophila]QEK11891.1 hypothetical protein FQB35_05635 [Crassaminicella thermophila]
MIKRIKINLDVIEGMLYFWQATSEKEKVGENYINEMSNFSLMEYIYDDEFNKESVRKVLSAISNRELLSKKNKKEGRFWNNNMWMLEDLEYTNMMIQPLKVLNLDFLVEKLNNIEKNSKYEEIEVIFLPGHVDEYKIVDNKLIINFFRVKPDLYEEKVSIGEKDIFVFIQEKLQELIKA